MTYDLIVGRPKRKFFVLGSVFNHLLKDCQGLSGRNSGRLSEQLLFPGCSKMPRCKAPEILRSEAYFNVRRNDEG